MFVAAYLYSVEDAEICIFSTGRRASQKLLELIKSLIEKLPNGRERILKFNQEILHVANYDGSSGASKLSSFPSNAKTLRGVGGNLVIMEEVSIQYLLFRRLSLLCLLCSRGGAHPCTHHPISSSLQKVSSSKVSMVSNYVTFYFSISTRFFSKSHRHKRYIACLFVSFLFLLPCYSLG